MKHGVKPTVAQRKLMQKWKLNPADWLVVKDEPVQDDFGPQALRH